MSKFAIIGRQREGTVITGYLLRDLSSGRMGFVDKDKVYELAMHKQIADVVAQAYNGKIVMKGTKCKISCLPCFDKDGNRVEVAEPKSVAPATSLILTGKVTEGKNIVAYRVTMYKHGTKIKESIVERDRVMQLAKEGLIENARYQSSNGVGILRGINCKLSSLENIPNYSFA